MIKKSEDWLVSYGDCVTLLICLLITIVVSLKGKSDKDVEWVADQVNSIAEYMQEQYPDTNIFKIHPRASSIKITLTGNSFESCRDDLNKEIIPIVKNLGTDLIRSIKKLDQLEKPAYINDSLYLEISIEGHTDSQKLPKGCGKYDNNWQLSASRAYQTMQVLTSDIFLNSDYNSYSKSVSVRGYADSHPICNKQKLIITKLKKAIDEEDKIQENRLRQKLKLTDFSDCNELNRRTEIIFTAFLMNSRGTYYTDISDDFLLKK
tara:strand:+ start:951 stop:1739 length:789 start_codon:yes stop_codon:yes gene_type:complete